MKRTMAMSVILLALAPAAALLAQNADTENPLNLSSHNVSLYVVDLDKEQAFYEKVLGFKLGSVRPDTDGETRQVVIPGYAIYLTWRNGLKPRPSGTGNLQPGWRHIVLATPTLDEVQKRLDAQKVPTKPAMVNGVLSRLRVFDPEGNEIEIIRAQ